MARELLKGAECAGCRYALEALGETGLCPECGRAFDLNAKRGEPGAVYFPPLRHRLAWLMAWYPVWGFMASRLMGGFGHDLSEWLSTGYMAGLVVYPLVTPWVMLPYWDRVELYWAREASARTGYVLARYVVVAVWLVFVSLLGLLDLVIGTGLVLSLFG